MASASRRDFLKVAGAAAAAGALPLGALWQQARSAPVPGKLPFDLGIASYTFRAFTLEQAIAMTVRVGITRLALKDVHLPMASTADDFARVRKQISDAGLTFTSCGVVYMTNEAEVHRAFEYAKSAGLSMMVGCPDASLLGLVESAVRSYDIRLAIHNHGPNDRRYPSPESAYRLVEKLDRRIGLCIDLGHAARLGLDPAAEVERWFDRVYDLHIKDVTSPDAAGHDIEIGRGVIGIPRLLGTLARLHYAGTVHIEHEKDEHDPLPGVAESAGYLRGVLATL